MKRIRSFVSYSFLFLFFGACSLLTINQERYSITKLPPHFPDVSFPEDNQYTAERWELGKKLFFDNILSIDSSISCASCHVPKFAFSDNRALSPGVKGRPGKRNAPSLANVAYHPYFLREGGIPTLEAQVLVPIQEENEFNHNIIKIGELLQKDSTYVSMAKKAYNRIPDYYVITRALGVFERTIISGNSKYDQFLNKKLKLSSQQKMGMDLFFSERLKCAQCHGGFNFTDYSFKNNGLYEKYKDNGRMRLTKDTNDIALFKVPTLRNIEITGPYMHDGSILTLKDVIKHYNSGGKSHNNKSALIKPLGLTEEEMEALQSFLFTLTDESFISRIN